MVVAPMLNGGRIENRWQPMSALTWCAPSSRSTSFIAAEDRPLGAAGAERRRAAVHAVVDGLRGAAREPTFGAAASVARQRRGSRSGAQRFARNLRTPALQHAAGVFAGHRQHVLAVRRGSGCRRGAGWC